MLVMDPASSIINRLGGHAAVADVLNVHISRVYGWPKPKERGGSGGLIPIWHVRPLLDYAEAQGIALTADDFIPPSEKVEVSA